MVGIREAVQRHYEAELAASLANLAPYLDEDRRVAIGEHPDHLLEARKLLEQAANAKDVLELISELSRDGRPQCLPQLHSPVTTKENHCPGPG